jgi:hypothetical protein
VVCHACGDVVRAVEHPTGGAAQARPRRIVRTGVGTLTLDDVVDVGVAVAPAGLGALVGESGLELLSHAGQVLDSGIDRARGHQRQRHQPVAMLERKVLRDPAPIDKPTTWGRTMPSPSSTATASLTRSAAE